MFQLIEVKQTDAELPCPFCGHSGIITGEGSGPSWIVAHCPNCGAMCGEVRRQDYGSTYSDAEDASVLAEWNRRPTPTWTPELAAATEAAARKWLAENPMSADKEGLRRVIVEAAWGIGNGR